MPPPWPTPSAPPLSSSHARYGLCQHVVFSPKVRSCQRLVSSHKVWIYQHLVISRKLWSCQHLVISHKVWICQHLTLYTRYGYVNTSVLLQLWSQCCLAYLICILLQLLEVVPLLRIVPSQGSLVCFPLAPLLVDNARHAVLTPYLHLLQNARSTGILKSTGILTQS